MYVHLRNMCMYDIVCHMFCHAQKHIVGIQSVFNLQQPGEHKNCGPGIEESSGFSYLPEDLMSEGC